MSRTGSALRDKFERVCSAEKGYKLVQILMPQLATTVQSLVQRDKMFQPRVLNM
jgi:hypothetical protein